MFWSIRQISPHLSYRGVQMLAFRCNHVQIYAGNTSKGAPAVSAMGREPCTTWARLQPSAFHGFTSKPLPQYFHHPFFCLPGVGAIDSSCGEVLLQHGEAVMWSGCGDTFPWTPHCGPELSGFGNWGGSAGGDALPATCPELGEHGI